MLFLVSLEPIDGILLRVVIDQLVALRAEQHQVPDVVRIELAVRVPSRPARAKGVDVRALGEVPALLGDMVF